MTAGSSAQVTPTSENWSTSVCCTVSTGSRRGHPGDRLRRARLDVGLRRRGLTDPSATSSVGRLDRHGLGSGRRVDGQDDEGAGEGKEGGRLPGQRVVA